MSKKAKTNLAVDSVIAAAFVLSALSGIILFLVPGGYQGGRNPSYGQEILFLDHHAWSDLHTWSSFLLVAGMGLHIALHWKWIVCMVKKTLHLGMRKASQRSCPVLVEVEQGLDRR